ncbi:hypothetical protein ACFS07_06115 [Undibacterium arcticum]
MVATGRSPLDRQYERLLFEDVYPDLGFIPLRHVGNLPHRIMSLAVSAVEPRWAATKHPLFNFFFRTLHADIDVGVHTLIDTAYKPTESAMDSVMRM